MREAKVAVSQHHVMVLQPGQQEQNSVSKKKNHKLLGSTSRFSDSVGLGGAPKSAFLTGFQVGLPLSI